MSDDTRRHAARDGLLDVSAALLRLAVFSVALGVLAVGPLVAFRLVRRWLR